MWPFERRHGLHVTERFAPSFPSKIVTAAFFPLTIGFSRLAFIDATVGVVA
jgi:hypothetical protein